MTCRSAALTAGFGGSGAGAGAGGGVGVGVGAVVVVVGSGGTGVVAAGFFAQPTAATARVAASANAMIRGLLFMGVLLTGGSVPGMVLGWVGSGPGGATG